jgi:methionine-rich copper-binding protein CopC
MQIDFALRARTWTGVVALSVMLAFLFHPLVARAEPELAQSTPPDGSVLAVPPEVVQLCFSEAVKDDEENWDFDMRAGGASLGLRIVFTTDGSCVDIYPGAAPDQAEGIWSLDWLVRAQADLSEASGAVHFQVGALQPGETPLPEPRDSPGPGGNDDSPIALLALAVVGGTIVALAVIGFVVRRLRRRAGA